MSSLAPVPAPAEAPIYPDHWTAAGRDAFDEVFSERPDLAGAAFASLVQACELITTADALDAVARTAGLVATGSTGQTVVHPGTVEARLARTAASAILGRIAPGGSGVMGSPERSRHAARQRWAK